MKNLNLGSPDIKTILIGDQKQYALLDVFNQIGINEPQKSIDDFVAQGVKSETYLVVIMEGDKKTYYTNETSLRKIIDQVRPQELTPFDKILKGILNVPKLLLLSLILLGECKSDHPHDGLYLNRDAQSACIIKGEALIQYSNFIAHTKEIKGIKQFESYVELRDGTAFECTNDKLLVYYFPYDMISPKTNFSDQQIYQLLDSANSSNLVIP